MADRKRQTQCSNQQEYYDSLSYAKKGKIAKAIDKYGIDPIKLKELMFSFWCHDETDEMSFDEYLEIAINELKPRRTCIHQTSNYTSQANGPITRGDMIGFGVMVGLNKDGDKLFVDGMHFTVRRLHNGNIHVIDEYGEIFAAFGEQTTWYNDWASQPCKWIGPEYLVDDIRDI